MAKRLILAGGLAFVASVLASHSNAYAAGWRLNPALCPDLREDIRDSRITWSRRDLREDYRDRAVTNCPAYAWTYVAPVGVPVTAVAVRPVYTGVYVARRPYYYGYRRVRPVRVNIRVH